MPPLDLDDFTADTTIMPGGRLLVGDAGRPRAWVTVTTAFTFGGQRYILTCGHESGTQLITGETRIEVAQLVVNLLAEQDPIDIALYRMTHAQTRILRPRYFASDADHAQVGEARVYTAVGGRRTEVSDLAAPAAHLQAILGSSQPLIACDLCTVEGDSGAPLHQLAADGSERLVGLHSGNNYRHSFFTPVRESIPRLLALL